MPKRKASPAHSTSPSKDSDVSYNSSLDGKRKKFSASRWLRSDLEALGVFYDKDPLSMEDFYDLLKERRRFELPTAVRPFIDVTKKMLNFSFSVAHIETSKVGGLAPPLEETVLCELLEKEQVYIIEYEEKFFSELSSKHREEKDLAKKLYKHWSTKVDDFLEDCKDLVQWLYHPELFTPRGISAVTTGRGEGKERESIYRDIFISWSKVFFLRPKIGDCKQTETVIREKEVGCIPEVRLYAQSNRGKVDPIMLLLCEVKRQAVMKIPDIDKEAWIAERLSADVLGQVGIELVTESANSEFRPYVLGIICMQTELIFTFLDIKVDHADAILTNKNTEGKRAHIHYTKSYNFLKADDRESLVEIFFWLGCLQKHNLYRYYMKK